MTVATSTTTQRANRGLIPTLSRALNPFVLRLAGTRLLPLYGVIKHRGRRSGTLFQTPVVVRPVRGGFIVPMPWGERTDWYRNVRAAGEFVIRWNGRDYRVVEPAVIDTAVAPVGPFLRGLMLRLGIRQSLRVRLAVP